MKTLHISTHVAGGAANSCIQLHKGLVNAGYESKLLSLYDKAGIPNHIYYYNLFSSSISRRLKWMEHLWMERQNSRRNNKFRGYQKFSYAKTPYDITKLDAFKEADIINLHWIADFLDYPSFFKKCNKPVVWTLHDMNPFSAGYHYTQGFDPSGQEELIRKNLLVKSRALEQFQAKLHIVSPSKWLMHESQSSELFQSYPHAHIPYGIDFGEMTSLSQQEARQYFNLNEGDRVFIFIANNLQNQIKGFDILLRLLQKRNIGNIKFLVVGGGSKEELRSQFSDSISEQLVFTGHLNGLSEISKAYTAADAFIMPSRQDNLPNTILESLCCGTPVIAFNIGGIPDMIQSGQNGILCGEVSEENLWKGIQSFEERGVSLNRREIREETREKYPLSKQASRYMALYESLL